MSESVEVIIDPDAQISPEHSAPPEGGSDAAQAAAIVFEMGRELSPVEPAANPGRLWPCGCPANAAGEHWGRCPDRDTTVPGRRVYPGELEEIEFRAKRGQMIHPSEALAMVRTIASLSHRVVARYVQTAEALERARDAEEEVAALDRANSSAARRVEDIERAWQARGPMADLGHLATAVTEVERLKRGLESARQEFQLVRETLMAALHTDPESRPLPQVPELAVKVAEELEQFRTWAAEQQSDYLNRRYTAEQVGELQTSEAELVSAPLKARLDAQDQQLSQIAGELVQAQDMYARSLQIIQQRDAQVAAQRDHIQSLERELVHKRRTMEQLAFAQSQVNAGDAGMQVLRGEITDLRRAIDERNQLLGEASQAQSQLEIQVSRMQVTVDKWSRLRDELLERINDQRVQQALKMADENTGEIEASSWAADMCADVVREVWNRLLRMSDDIQVTTPDPADGSDSARQEQAEA